MVEEYHFAVLDLLPYTLLVLLLFIFSLTKNKQNYNAKLCIWVIFLFSAVRYGVGYDYFSYQALAMHNVEDYQIYRLEPFARFLTYISSITHFQVFFVLSSCLICYPLYRGCVELSYKPAVSITLYVLFPVLFLESISIVRNAIAYSLVFWAYALLQKEDRLKSVLIFICAILFHYSAIIGIFLYILWCKPLSRGFFIFFFVGSFLLSSFTLLLIESVKTDNLLMLRLKHNLGQFGSGGSMRYVINLLGIFCLFFWDSFKKKVKNGIYYLNFICAGVCLWNIFLPINSTLSLRLSTFFTMFIIVLIPSIEKIFKRKMKLYSKVCVLGMFFLLFCSSLFINIRANIDGGRVSMFPYQTIFHYKDYKGYKYDVNTAIK